MSSPQPPSASPGSFAGTAISEILAGCMQRDRHRLRSVAQRLERQRPANNADQQTLARWQTELERWQAQVKASCDLVAERSAAVGPMTFDPELPITERRDEIIELLRTRQTIVVCGETGSGKSTQLPKICLEAGLGRRGIIGHTQPRRLAARAVASRVAEELGSRIGDRVGFKIRFTDKTTPTTLVKLMTDGVLLAETQSDRFLDQYEVIIIDEAHERSLNIDFLIAYLKRLIVRRHDLKLIITSATIDPEKFAEHFADDLGPAPIVNVQGRTYPVEIRYRDPALVEASDEDSSPTDGTPLTALAHAVDEVCAVGQGDVLVFLPTERDIRLAAKYLRGWFTTQGRLSHIEILPLYARLSEAEQNRIFQSHSARRLVLATNVAESSLTVPGIHYVIDTGTARISRYAPRQRVQRLPIEAVSQASADQRAGRCGRLGPGVCIRLYSQEDYASRSRFTTPEIRRSDLAAVILQCATLRLGELLELPLLDPPTPEAVRDGQRTLIEIGAMDDRFHLTKTGGELGKLPCDPRVGRMLLAAHEHNVLGDVLVIAAALESQDVRLRPPGQQPAADEAHLQFRDPHSDFLSLLRLWHFYEKLRSSLSRSRLGKALEQKFLSLQRFREWADIVRQLKEMLHTAGYKIGAAHVDLPELRVEQLKADAAAESEQSSSKRGRQDARPARAKITAKDRPPGYDAIHQSLLTGLLSGLGTLGDNRLYQGAGNSTFALWPGSGLFQRTPKWIMVAEQLETTRRYGRTAAEIDVAWVEKLAAHLLKHSYADPHWSRKAQTAMVYRRSTLYGLPVVDRRAILLAPIDPQLARNLFITHALVQGESQCREKFLVHNQKLLKDLQEMAERSRRRELLVDPYVLEQFYAQRLPENVVDLPSLRKWLQQQTKPSHHAKSSSASGNADPERQLYLQPEDVVGHSLTTPPAEHFPDQLQVGPTRLPLAYRFHPGDAADGVTVTLPKVALRQVSEEALGWLVPGLLEDKLLHMIRALPKHLRRNFVPAPDVARKLADELLRMPRDIPFNTAVCEVMTRYANEPVTATDFNSEKLPDHLRFRIKVIDDAGKVLGTSRDLTQLQSELAAESPEASISQASVAVPSQWNERRVTALTVQELPESIIPESIIVVRGGVKVAAYPTIVDDGDAVILRLVDNRETSQRLTAQGWLRLFAMKFRKQLTSQVSHLPALDKSGVLLARLVNPAALREQLRDLIARLAFMENQPPLRDLLEYEARCAAGSGRISAATHEIALWLPQFAEHYHAIRLLIESAPGLWKEVADDIAAQLKELTDDDFLKRVSWSELKEYPRYLHAARIRWEKLRSGGIPKDRKLRESIDRLLSRYRELSITPGANTESLRSARNLIEELRVSTFAQQLGTRQSVSVKRIEELL